MEKDRFQKLIKERDKLKKEYAKLIAEQMILEDNIKIIDFEIFKEKDMREIYGVGRELWKPMEEIKNDTTHI